MNDRHELFQRKLYAVTPADWPAAKLVSAVALALAGGVRLVQYRAKPSPDPAVARELLHLCLGHEAGLIINDDVQLAAAISAHGVHLGREDASLSHARRMLGERAIIGASCYNDLDRAARLVDSGADYLAFGSVFASPTKPDAVHCAPEILTRAREFGRPVVAIGGITLENAAQAIAAGADMVAVISGLFGADDLRARARSFQELL